MSIERIGDNMILSGLIMGAAVIAGASLLVKFWNTVVSWLKRVYEKIRTVVQGVLQGTTIFFKKIGEAAKEISKNYAKVGTKWQETVVMKSIGTNEIPEEYLQTMRRDNVEYEFTDELEMQLNA